MGQNLNLKKCLETGIKAAEISGGILLREQGCRRAIRYKGEINLVTDADLKSQEALVRTIGRAYPDHAFLAEEKDKNLSCRESDYCWIIDPLDGTTNFVHGYPLFSISIALRVQNRVELGIVYLPFLKEMFTAVRGEGAFLNRKKIRVSRAGKIGKSLLVTGFPYYIHERSRRVLAEFNRVVRAARGIRRDGSAAIDLAFVACGRFDGFFERDLKIWDVSGGDLLVTEAGGRVTDYRAERSGLPSEIVATNGKIHRQLLDLVN
ncbi:MAG: inositol monophosphatase family protein [Proteobacteria bacterium]|nr:inositol monophosphatase family protein [Pseudomonadota bacterium]